MACESFVLPDDVANIVKEYSKPLMRHSQAYKEAMFALGMTDLFEVKQFLYTDSADRAIDALTGYAIASVALKDAEQEAWSINEDTYPDLEERWNKVVQNGRMCRKATKLKREYHQKICWLVAGKEEPEEEVSDVEEDEENFEDLTYEVDREDD
jgi:hypothetical protein